jgi:hypothetical protein
MLPLCQKEKNADDKKTCQGLAQEYINVSVNIATLQTSIRQNLITLQAYKKFPLEMQKRLTISQRYMSEASDTVKWVSSDITSRMNVNARRIESYTDAIILMVGAIKSRQAIIDFSVNRKSKCGQCTVDNYDYYSCALKLLCPKLPILKIPPFRIPNISIDLSKIRLGMDVTLPKVQFAPRSMPLPSLPTIPQPPTLNLNPDISFAARGKDFSINTKNIVPTIPQLPAPPRLPELPSIIPSIDLNLPTLPPAPRVPRLAPAITSTLKVAGTIAKILCIVKGGISLVGEKWVKTRIEQQTQRRRDVQPFDSLSLTRIDPPLRWFDIKVETYVDFEINFEQLYTMLDEITRVINKKTNSALEDYSTAINEASLLTRGFSEDAQSAINSLGITKKEQNALPAEIDSTKYSASYNAENSTGATTIKTQIPSSIPWASKSQQILPTKNSPYTSTTPASTLPTPASQNTKPSSAPIKTMPKIPYNDTDHNTTTPDILRSALSREIAALKASDAWEQYSVRITEIENVLATPSIITPTYESVHQATHALQWVLTKTSRTLEEQKQQINDYDRFLDTTRASALINQETVEGTINAQLFAPSPAVRALLENSEHPMRSYFNLHKKMVDGFAHALETRWATNLNMWQRSYNKLLTYFHATQSKIAAATALLPEPKKRWNQYVSPTYVEKTLQTNTQTINATTNQPREIRKEKPQQSLSSDLFTLTRPARPASDSITPQTDTPVSTTLITPVYAAEILPSQPTRKLWAIWRDEHRIMTNQSTAILASRGSERFTRFYLFDTITKYIDLQKMSDDRGFITKFNSAFAVFSLGVPIVSYNADGQSNKTVSIHRKNTGQPVYLIKLTKRIQSIHERFNAKDSDRTYALAYASGYTLDQALLDLPDEPRKKIAELAPSIISHQIVFDPEQEDIAISLPLWWDYRSYTSIIPASITTTKGIQNIRPIAQRSAIETLGVQRRWDTSPPRARARIIDRKTKGVIAEWNSMTIPRKWSYDLIIQWTDDVIVVGNSIQELSRSQPITANNGEWYRSDIPRTKNLIVAASATDQNNNRGNQNITIVFTDPTIAIERVEQAYDERTIISNLSQLYPDGFVKFYSAADATISSLTGSVDKELRSDFDTRETSTYTTGWVFYDANTISLFAADKSRIARIDKASGRITLTPTWEKRALLILDITDNTPRVAIIDTINKQTIFSLYLKAQKITNSIPRPGVASIADMPPSTIGTFAWWQCVKDTKDICVIYLTSVGDIYIPDIQKSRIWWVYTYNNGVIYTMTIDGVAAVDIRFIPQPLQK